MARMEEGRSRSAFKILTGTSTPAVKEPLGKPRCIWEDNIRMNLKELVSIRGIGLIWFRIWIIGGSLGMRN